MPSSTERDLVHLAAELLRALRDRGMIIATAESSTGGLIGHLLTEVPGSSDAYCGGAVTYSNELKQQFGVPKELLERDGAVSAPTAEAMARAAREVTGADIAIAVTGIAGPGGGTGTKPVGTTFVGLSDARGEMSQAHVWRSDRSTNKLLSAQAAMRLALQRVKGSEG